MSRLQASLRAHLPFIIIAPLLVIVMTWPTFAHVFDSDTFWLHSGAYDTWYKFWDTWHLKRVLAGEADFYFTDAIFFPQGVSLAFHQIALPHALVFGALQEMMPAANAYNLCFLLILFFNALTTYACLARILGDRWIGLFGAIVVGLSPLVIGSPTLPDLILVGMLPLSVYFFHRSVIEERWIFAVLSGVVIGVTAFTGMYILVCTLLTLGLYGACLALSRWKNFSFWRRILLLICVASSIGVLRFYPMLAERDVFNEGISKYTNLQDSNDVLDYLVNTANPLTTPILSNTLGITPRKVLNRGYIGYIPLALIAIGFLSRRYYRRMLPWLMLLCIFLILRLGSYLTFNGQQYPDIMLPKHYLNQLFPLVFEPFGLSARFQIGVLLPLAAFSCYGLKALLRALPPGFRIGAVCVCVALLAAEYFVPIKGKTLEHDRTAHLEWLRNENQHTIRLINLPMRRDLNKYYMYLQTLGAYPQANGATNRTPSAAYTYMIDSYLLGAWRNGRNINCSPAKEVDFMTAVDQLQADGFTHIVFHRRLTHSTAILPGLTTAQPDYEDDHVTIYRLESLRESCLDTALVGRDALSPFEHLAQATSILPDDDVSLLSVHPSKPIDYHRFEDYAYRFSDWKNLIHFFRIGDETVVQSMDKRHSNIDQVASLNDALLLMYDPRIMNPDQADFFKSYAGRYFKYCQRIFETEGTIIEFYVKPAFPCGLLLSSSPIQASYENGLWLDNLHYELNDSYLDVYILWKHVPEVIPAFSMQLFDEAGNKSYGQDFVIHPKPALHQRLDISSLPPGDYVAKLIVYNYSTGVSVPGTITSAQTRFDRELEIARLTIE